METLTVTSAIALEYAVISHREVNPLILIAAPVAAIAIAVAIVRPDLLLRAIFVLAPALWAFGFVNLFNVGPLHLNLPILVGGITFFSLSRHALRAYVDPGIRTVQRLALTFALVTIPAIFFAADLTTGVGAYARLLTPLLIMFATYSLSRDTTGIRTLANAMFLSLIPFALIVAYEIARGNFFILFGGHLSTGLLYLSPQHLGGYQTLMIGVAALNYGLTHKARYLLVIPILLLGVFLTFERTFWVGAFVILFLLTVSVKRSQALRWTALLMLTAIALGAGQIFVAFTTLRPTGSVIRSPLDALSSGRISVDRANFEAYMNSPLQHKVFGIGLYRSLDVTERATGRALIVHDDYLAVLVETGFVSLLIYLALLSTLMLIAFRNTRDFNDTESQAVAGTALAVIIAVVVMGIAGAWYTNVLSTSYIYGLMGLMFASAEFRRGGIRSLSNQASEAVARQTLVSGQQATLS